MKKIYLAGPTCFYAEADEIYDSYIKSLRNRGLDAVVPSDGNLSKGAKPGFETANRIFIENVEKIKSCDGIIADLTTFRGAESDSGTAFEVGFAYAFNKPIVGFMIDRVKNPKELISEVKISNTKFSRLIPVYSQIVNKYYEGVEEINGILIDKYECQVENMGLPLNLMLGMSVPYIGHSFDDAANNLMRLLIDKD